MPATVVAGQKDATFPFNAFNGQQLPQRGQPFTKPAMHVLGNGISQRVLTLSMQQLRNRTSRVARTLFTPKVGTIKADRMRSMNGR